MEVKENEGSKKICCLVDNRGHPKDSLSRAGRGGAGGPLKMEVVRGGWRVCTARSLPVGHLVVEEARERLFRFGA